VDLPVPILRTVAVYNKNQHPIEDFDVSKLQYATPTRAEGATTARALGDAANLYYKDGLGNICVPLVYDGTFAMNHGFVLSHGKFDIVESSFKGERAFQLFGTYPVHRVDEDLVGDAASDSRKLCMLRLLRAIHAAETQAKKWIVADAGKMFGSKYTEADLATTAPDGAPIKSAFHSQIYAGVSKMGGEAALLKSYFKLPHVTAEDGTVRLYCELAVNGKPVDSFLPAFVEHVNWKNNVGIVFSFRDLYKSATGISLRTRIDVVGAWSPPRGSYIAIKNPFLADAAGKAIEEDD
jgi:hypothetical protein